VVGSTARMPPTSLTATLRLGGQDWPFRVYTRSLALGSSGRVQYYWMDSSQLRNPRSEAAQVNFRSIVGFWGAAMQEMGWWDLDQEVNYVLAVCYALVGKNKSLQHVYRDAYLAPHAVDRSDGLCEETRTRIRNVVRSRDYLQVRKELDETLGRFDIPAAVLPILQEAFRHWVGTAVVRMRQRGNDGLEEFLAETDHWLARYRKRSDRWVRQFLDLFAYECKAAFHTCYANAWVGLIPWLRENRELDAGSERFLRFWHHQNQPIEVPHGLTVAGILYPTHQFLERGGEFRQSLVIPTERIGPTHLRDVFNGQVLSLHPLSGFFMKDPGLCAVAGQFFLSDAYERVFRQREPLFCREYWSLIQAILAAAYLYRQALDRQAEGRSIRRDARLVEGVTSPSADCDEAALLTEYVASRQIRCPNCGGALELRGYRTAGEGESEAPTDFACSACGRQLALAIQYGELVDWLRHR
jgi:hypothetical protein